MVAVGVDACKTGWIAVTLVGNDEPAAYYLPTIDALADTVPNPTAIAIDIPIGLPDAGRRNADVEARIHLGQRRNSLFFTPVRSVLEAVTHASATSLSSQITGSGVSQQSYALAKKIFEVEQWLPTAPCDVWEVHPELSFALLLGHPARASKKSWAGMVERRDVLANAGIQLDRIRGEAASRAAADDMLDGGIAAWSASRLLDGSARCFPDPPERDRSGRAIAIWA